VETDSGITPGVDPGGRERWRTVRQQGNTAQIKGIIIINGGGGNPRRFGNTMIEGRTV
jgi:hypothetical protein